MLEIEAKWDNATNVAITAAHTYNLFYYVDEKKQQQNGCFLVLNAPNIIKYFFGEILSEPRIHEKPEAVYIYIYIYIYML